jgi:hypothetical protein
MHPRVRSAIDSPRDAEVVDESSVPLRGLVSPSTLPGYVRLYTNADWLTWLEIPDELVEDVEEETPSTPENPLGESVVWVKRIRPPDDRPLIRAVWSPGDPDEVAHRPQYWPPPKPPRPPRP